MPIANNDPYFGALPPPDQDPRMVAQNQQAGGSKPQSGPLDDILMRMITQNLGQAPPPERPLNNWEVFAGLMHPELINVLMARKQDTPQWQQYNAAQKQMPSLLQAYSSEQSRLGTNERFMQTQQRLGTQFDERMNLGRYVPGQVSYNDPQRGNVTMQVWKDKLTGQIMDENRQPIELGPLTSAIHFQNYAGPGGENIQAPTVPMPQAGQQVVPRPSSTGIGHTPSPTLGSGIQGGQPQNTAPVGAAGQPTRKGTAHFNPAAAERVAGQSAFAAGLDDLMAYQQRAHGAQTNTFGQAGLSPTGIPALAGQAVADVASQHGYTQPFLQGSPLQAVTDYNVNMRPMLFNYVKQQTGVQFGMKEFNMYASQFPTSLDDTDTAIEKLGGLVRSVRQRNIAESQQFGGIEPDPKFTAFVGKQMPRSVLHTLPPAERLRFIVGGGQVTE